MKDSKLKDFKTQKQRNIKVGLIDNITIFIWNPFGRDFLFPLYSTILLIKGNPLQNINIYILINL